MSEQINKEDFLLLTVDDVCSGMYRILNDFKDTDLLKVNTEEEICQAFWKICYNTTTPPSLDKVKKRVMFNRNETWGVGDSVGNGGDFYLTITNVVNYTDDSLKKNIFSNIDNTDIFYTEQFDWNQDKLCIIKKDVTNILPKIIGLKDITLNIRIEGSIIEKLSKYYGIEWYRILLTNWDFFEEEMYSIDEFEWTYGTFEHQISFNYLLNISYANLIPDENEKYNLNLSLYFLLDDDYDKLLFPPEYSKEQLSPTFNYRVTDSDGEILQTSKAKNENGEEVEGPERMLRNMVLNLPVPLSNLEYNLEITDINIPSWEYIIIKIDDVSTFCNFNFTDSFLSEYNTRYNITYKSEDFIYDTESKYAYLVNTANGTFEIIDFTNNEGKIYYDVIMEEENYLIYLPFKLTYTNITNSPTGIFYLPMDKIFTYKDFYNNNKQTHYLKINDSELIKNRPIITNFYGSPLVYGFTQDKRAACLGYIANPFTGGMDDTGIYSVNKLKIYFDVEIESDYHHTPLSCDIFLEFYGILNYSENQRNLIFKNDNFYCYGGEGKTFYPHYTDTKLPAPVTGFSLSSSYTD